MFKEGFLGQGNGSLKSFEQDALFFFIHFPTQNVEKILERTSSVTLIPMIVPSSLSAVRISETRNSGEISVCMPSMTVFKDCAAFSRASKWRLLVRMTSPFFGEGSLPHPIFNCGF